MEQSKKISRKVISVVLSLLMVFSCFSGMSLTAWATSDKTVAGLGTSAIGNPTSTNSSASAWAGSYVYYGKYDGTSPTKYRVLDKASNDFGVDGGSLLLDCDTTLYNAKFHDSNNAWSSSSLKSGLQGDAFWNKSGVFTEQEKDAIASSTKADAAQNDGSGSNILSYAALSDDTVFVLDAKEASRASYGYASKGARKKSGTSGDGWWLRSPNEGNGKAGFVLGTMDVGRIGNNIVSNNNGGVSPAFNINLSSVIFTSLITGTAGAAGAEYKLTLKDDKLGIARTTGKKVAQSENKLTIPYTVSGDNSANATQVSVLVTDKAYTESDATILKYGKLADVTSTSLSGTADFTLPDGLTGTLGTDYHIYLLTEDVNGEKETDYANLKEITADDINSAPTETLLTKITPTGIDTYSESVPGVVTVTLSNISRYSSGWAYGGTVTVAPKEGYTITKCIFDARAGAVEDTEAPFSIDVGSATYVRSVEVYGYQAASDSYIDGSGESQTVNATELAASTTSWTNGSWYIVPAGGLTISGRITVNGTVNLILRDGATLTASAGITTTGATLNIYAQSAGTGTLTAKGSNGARNSTGGSAGIGGCGGAYEENGGAGGTVSIFGGTVTATGGNSSGGGGGAGIGGGGAGLGRGQTGGAGGTVSIFGGTITATGGDSEDGGAGAGIGGGGKEMRGSAGANGALTLGKGVKLYSGTNNSGTVLDGSDSTARSYSGSRPQKMFAEFISAGSVDKTALNDAITAAETLYNSIKDDTNYSTIAVTLKTAIDAAKEVADSETADQDAVDTAKTAITTAKTNAEAAKKDVDDTNAANAVITKINALPATESVTSENKDAIEAARAAYNALTDDQKKKVDATVLAKLTDAETALQDAIDTETAGAATNTINALPDADKVTTADKEKIEAARKAYNDLTDDQKKKVSDDTLKKLTDAEDALAAATVSEEIGTLPDADKITAENKAAIEAAKKAYDELTDEQKQYVDKTTKEKLETAVTALAIVLLPAADEITAANKEAIEAARKAYNALSDEQKSELGTATKEKLEAAEAALAIAVLPAADDVTSENKEAIEAARKAYDALNDEQKASVGTAAKQKLEAAEAALAIALLPTPSDVSAEDKEAIEAARKAYDALNDAQKASVGKTAKEKLEAAEAALAIVLLPETDEITTEDKAEIEAARKAYDALNDAQKALAGDEVKAKLEAAEVALTKALVEALPAADKVTAEDKDAIEEARKAYNALTDEQKLSVGEDAKAVLEAAEAALAIAELPAADKVTAEDKAAIEAAAKAYDALSDEQKEMVGEAAKSKLEAAKAALAIALLPEADKVTSADKADIEAARKAYDALTDEQKSELGTAAKEKLEAVEVKLTKELISELPSAGAITTADATDVAAAKETFDKLNDEQKKGITPAQKAKLEAAVQALSDAEVYEVRTAINKLPVASEVTAENEEAIKDARKAYDALTDEQKVFVGETAKSKLITDEAAHDIAKPPAQSDVTAEDKDDIAAARKTYDALTLAQKEELGENAKKKLDNAEVGLVERQLEALPTEVTGSEREAIEAARKAYDALTDEQKASVNPETLKKLTDAEAVIDAAEKEAKDTAAANAVSDTINAIPAASEVTPENKDAIEAARKAYEELTDDQKAKVTPETLKKLTDAETALKEAIDTAAAKDATDKINAVPETDKVTTKDEAAIDAARKAYDALTEDQKAKIAPETLKKLTDAEEALTVAKNNVAAFNANKALEQKAADELALATDSAAGKKLIANAKAALDKLAYDESKTPEENKAAQQAVLTKLKADLKEQRVWESEVARAKLNSNARGTANKKGFNVTWGAAPNAAKYVVYAAYCDGKSAYKKVATVKGDVNSYSITKLGGKKVDTSKCIRVYIIAYRLVNGKYVKVAQSVALHIAGVNNKTQTNAKAITVKNDSLTLKLNKSTTLKPTIVRENAKKKMSAHTAQFRYQSTNLRVVKVDANGKITAVGKGTATIYVFANNGKLKSVKITVK